jgi:hypothetical protein
MRRGFIRMDKGKLELARDKYSNVPPVVNNMEGWLIDAPWGIGLRFYPIGTGYAGMRETLIDGAVTLLERLGGAEND